MNRTSFRWWVVVEMAVVFLLSWSLGCRPEVPIASEVTNGKLRSIGHLQLEPMDEPNASKVPVVPPAEMELSLEQCRVMALNNNLELQATLVDPTLAAERISQERARFESTFTVGTSINKTDQPSINQQSQIQGRSTKNLNTSIGLEKPTETGGSMSLRVSDGEVDTDASGTPFNPYYSAGTVFSLSQPLLRNAGIRTAKYGIHLAGLEQRITEARTQLGIIRILADMDRVYWRLYAAIKEREVRQQQYELAQAQLAQVQRLVDSGQRSQVEILRSEAGVAGRLESIILADNSLRDRERELKRILNQPELSLPGPTRLLPLTDPVPQRYDLHPEELIRTAMDRRMELLEMELQLLEDRTTIQFRKNQTLPLVTLDYRYNINAFGGSRGDSYDMLYDSQYADHYFGLNARIPLGNQSAKSQLRQARLQRYQRIATRKNREALIKLEVLNAIDQLESNWQRIMATQQNVLLAGRLYEAEKRQFELGLRTSTDVLDTQASLANAQSAEIAALVEYQVAMVDLAYATGMLLGAANVDWEPIVPEMTSDS